MPLYIELAYKTEANTQAVGWPDFDHLELNSFVLKNRIAKKTLFKTLLLGQPREETFSQWYYIKQRPWCSIQVEHKRAFLTVLILLLVSLCMVATGVMPKQILLFLNCNCKSCWTRPKWPIGPLRHIYFRLGFSCFHVWQNWKKRKFFMLNHSCLLCWVLWHVWRFEWPNLCETASFNVWAEKVPRVWFWSQAGFWFEQAPGSQGLVLLGYDQSHRTAPMLRWVEIRPLHRVEIMQHTARKSGFLLKYRAQTTHAGFSLSALQFASGFLPNSHLDFQETGNCNFPCRLPKGLKKLQLTKNGMRR